MALTVVTDTTRRSSVSRIGILRATHRKVVAMAKKELAPVLFDDLDAGRLPHVCVMTGAPATKTIHKTFVNAPAWPFLLWPISFVAALVGRMAGSESLSAELPVAGGVKRLRGITARQERGWLILSGVHPSFARAIGKFYADRADELPIR